MRNRISLQNHAAFLIEDDESLTPIDSLSSHLSAYVYVGENFTFGDLWKFIEMEPSFYEKVFKVAMGYYTLAPFIKDAENPDMDADVPDEDGIMTGLEVSALFQSRKSKKEIYVQSEFDFHGYGKDKENRDTWFGISFQSLSALMKYPFRVVTQARFYVIEQYKATLDQQGSYDMLLFDMLYAIFDEITFYGEPSNRSATLATLDQRVAQAKEDLQDEDK